jgi:hypothetical protein
MELAAPIAVASAMPVRMSTNSSFVRILILLMMLMKSSTGGCTAGQVFHISPNS